MTLTSQIDCQRSVETSTPPGMNTPAFEQNRSIGPTSASVSSTTRTTSDPRVTSAVMAVPPTSAATRRGAVGVDIDHHHVTRALGCEPGGKCPADSAGPAGHNCDGVLDPHLVSRRGYAPNPTRALAGAPRAPTPRPRGAHVRARPMPAAADDDDRDSYA